MEEERFAVPVDMTEKQVNDVLYEVNRKYKTDTLTVALLMDITRSIRMYATTPALTWYPIDTAPKNKVILLSDGKTRWFDALPSDFLSIEEWLAEMSKRVPRLPTHWMEVGLP